MNCDWSVKYLILFHIILDKISKLRYNRNMENTYRRTATTVSMVNYHFVFCPRYRRKIFVIDGAEPLFKETVRQICEANDIEILALECQIDHCHLFVNAPPKLSPADIMAKVKGGTSKVLRENFLCFAYNKQLWTRSYFVSTAGEVSTATIQQYINTQKTR